MLEINDLTIGYQAPRTPTHVVAEGIDASIGEGELVCLIGPNGAGKSTFMRTLAGMQAPLGGRVLIDGANIHDMSARDRARSLGVVLTDRVATGLLSAYALVGLGRFPHTNWSGTLTDHDHAVIERAIRMVGAEALAHRNVSELSDGEQQKVMLARALAQEPRLMILDEITAFLDLPRRVESLRLLRRLARQNRQSILLSTHDLDLALRSADRIWLLPKDGPLQAGAPEDLVLSGAFEATFAAEGVDFDRARGAFRIHRPPIAKVALTGHGVERYWTHRALERAGLEVREDGRCAQLGVAVLRDGGATHWQVHRADRIDEFDSIHEMLASIVPAFDTVQGR
jgi:iron complex transport system ATP-binding protein